MKIYKNAIYNSTSPHKKKKALQVNLMKDAQDLYSEN